jgi:murein DD-endopeptidase MepM/ murein hydrolase activator NlpD
MHRSLIYAALALSLAPSAVAAAPDEEAQVAEQQMLGCSCEQAARLALLPFTRAIGVSGIVKGSLEESATAAGVPTATMLEALKAFATEIDLAHDVKDGDRFYVRYEQTYTLAGDPIDVGHVLWAELKTKKRGVLALHRFKPAHDTEASLWFASGHGTLDPVLMLPIEHATVTSGFGLRADPFDQPMQRMLPMGPVAVRGPAGAPLLDPGPKKGQPNPSPLGSGALNVNQPTAAGLAAGLAPAGSAAAAAPPSGGALAFNQPTQRGLAMGLVSPNMYMSTGRGPSYRGPMTMHAGVDLLAAPNTPIEAAGEGVVVGAQPNGRYGNWIEIDHGDHLATVYGHLTSFADGIAPGAHVHKGDLIGFTGNTGRTTGPHLHFEILTNGHPGNPIGHAATKHAQLRGSDMEKFRTVVAEDVAEREREAKSM